MFRTTGEGVILEANESFARTLGHAGPAALLGRHLREFYVEPERWDLLRAGLRVARSVANLEVALHRPNRSVVWVLMSVARTGTDASSGLEGYIVDITARRRADDLLRETAALRSVAALANAAKAVEEIVGRMSQIMRLELTEQSETLPEMLDLRRSASAPPAPESPGR